jgi:hypothetical protein
LAVITRNPHCVSATSLTQPQHRFTSSRNLLPASPDSPSHPTGGGSSTPTNPPRETTSCWSRTFSKFYFAELNLWRTREGQPFAELTLLHGAQELKPATKKMPIEVIDSMGNEIFGAEEGTRTPTPLPVHGPEPCASANSATSALSSRGFPGPGRATTWLA